ncbi:MAG: signal peptide peptidase SppA [Pseudomonadota bacterium]|nr:signal peptide peptidase SppA [Pseudomonadota bacterium]
MASTQPGGTGRFFRRLWNFIDISRRVVLNLIFLVILAMVLFAIAKSGPPPIAEKTALVLNLHGSINEQRAGSVRGAALEQFNGEAPKKMQLRDVLAVLDTAAADAKIGGAVLILDELEASGFSTLREIAAGVDRFRASGKKVVAWGSSYDQRQYYIAAHADEVYLHPQGEVSITGFGGVRNYYKDALDKLGVSFAFLHVGTYKTFGEPFTLNGPSPAAIEADTALLGSLWKTYTDDVEKQRKMAAGSIMQVINDLPARVTAAGGDVAKLALQMKAVDGLKTRDELRALMIERGAKDEEEKTFRQISFDDYLARIKPQQIGDAIGVVVAEGEITDGIAPAGTIGGRSTAELIRRARESKDVKAVVLRVNSPGGSSFGSELVRRELELTRAAGKPVVVSMGDVAASGGYWISTAADEIFADAATITGSIGVFALLPNATQTLEKIGVHSVPLATTWLRVGADPRVPLDPRLAEVIQKSVEHTYAEFLARAAQARKTTTEKIDAVGQGRVWTGLQAKERNLVDRIGLFGDALKSAATRAKLDKPRIVYIERDPGTLARLIAAFNAQVQAVVGAHLDSRLDELGIPAALSHDAARDLAWLGRLNKSGQPFQPSVHCLCGASF